MKNLLICVFFTLPLLAGELPPAAQSDAANVQKNANHLHAIWRDFTGDFGRDLLREHYSGDH